MKENLLPNENTASDTNRSGLFENHSINATSANESDFALDYPEKLEILQASLMAPMNRKGRVIRLHRCFGCKRNFGIKKMSILLIFCRGCFALALDKNKVARRNFIDRALNECRIFLGVHTI
jgi:hypothetical protein